MEDLPVFAEAYGYTPAEFRALSFRDWRRLRAHLERRADDDG